MAEFPILRIHIGSRSDVTLGSNPNSATTTVAVGIATKEHTEREWFGGFTYFGWSAGMHALERFALGSVLQRATCASHTNQDQNEVRGKVSRRLTLSVNVK